VAVTSIKNKIKSGSLLVGNSYYVPPSFESIATVTGTGSSGTITFSSIPGTYTHLQLRYLSRGTTDNVMYLRINSDTGTNYSDHALYGNGTSAATLSDVSNTRIAQFRQSDSATTAQMGVGIIDIHDYASTTKNKTIRALTGYDANGTGIVMLTSGQRINTAAITTLTLNVDGGFFSSNSTFALYGIKGA
jgi:hypothetical protein